MPVLPRTLSGFKDYLPEEALLKENLLHNFIGIFRRFGFLPIQTPHLEYADILSKQGSDEIQKEMYRFIDHGGREVALRFDQTVPLARFVTQHKNIGMPFKRYAIGNVFRGERAQKGRYREFTQCDFDCIGSNSIACDAEIVHVIYTCMRSLNMGDFCIAFNHRKILNGIAQHLGIDDIASVLRIIDKLDKIGKDGVENELKATGLESKLIHCLLDCVLLEARGVNIKDFLTSVSSKINNESFIQGIEELQEFYTILQALNLCMDSLRLTFSIARGLGYYTGIVYETTFSAQPELGSVCSGGRYDNLTQHFSQEPLSGVGASIGIDRLLVALADSPQHGHILKTLVIAMDKKHIAYCAQLADNLRSNDRIVELYPDIVRLKKALQYANTRHYDEVIIIGDDERAKGLITIKNLHSGEQKSIKYIVE